MMWIPIHVNNLEILYFQHTASQNYELLIKYIVGGPKIFVDTKRMS